MILHKTGCELCGDKIYDMVKEVSLCYKHFNSYTERITKKCVSEDKFKERYIPPKVWRQKRIAHWSSNRLQAWMNEKPQGGESNRVYCTRLRNKTKRLLSASTS